MLLNALFAAALALPTADAASRVQLNAEDGTRVSALTDAVKGSKRGVVLVHMVNREAADYGHLSERLSRSELQVISPDLRGHGQSGGPTEELTASDYEAMVMDVNAAIGWLRTQGVEEVSCLGASLGANLCMRAAAEDKGIVNVVLLSPGLNYKGVTIGPAMKQYGNRPLLVVASDDDTASARAATVLNEAAKGQSHLMILEEAGHGTKMLNRDPSLEGVTLSWLLGTFQLATGEVVTPRPELDNTGTVETEGQKLDAHR